MKNNSSKSNRNNTHQKHPRYRRSQRDSNRRQHSQNQQLRATTKKGIVLRWVFNTKEKIQRDEDKIWEGDESEVNHTYSMSLYVLYIHIQCI